MPRFFFNVRDRFDSPPDAEGRELPDLASARAEAVAGARSLICDGLGKGILDLSGSIEVLDERGRRALLLRFEEAVLRRV